MYIYDQSCYLYLIKSWIVVYQRLRSCTLVVNMWWLFDGIFATASLATLCQTPLLTFDLCLVLISILVWYLFLSPIDYALICTWDLRSGFHIWLLSRAVMVFLLKMHIKCLLMCLGALQPCIFVLVLWAGPLFDDLPQIEIVDYSTDSLVWFFVSPFQVRF